MSKKQKIFHGQKFGQGLIEVIVALGAAAVIVTAITISVLTSLNNALFSKNQQLATKYAQQGIEIIRNIRDSDYQGFLGLTSSGKAEYCLGVNALKASDIASSPMNGSTGCGPNIGQFSRHVIIDPNPGTSCIPATPTPAGGPTPIPEPETKVNVVVYWSDGKCTQHTPWQSLYCHEVFVSSCFGESPFLVPTPR